LTTATLTTGDSSSQTFSGRLQDGAAAVALTLTGGTLTLSGTNTYSGGTYVEGGTLILTNSAALADGSSLTVGNAGLFPAPVIPAAAMNGEPLAVSPPVAPVPEPAALALLTAAVCGAAVARWIRRGVPCRVFDRGVTDDVTRAVNRARCSVLRR
jgi:autotransporter-associated beta strand protein